MIKMVRRETWILYGDGTFSSIRDGKLKLRYSKLKMNNMNNGNLDFKYSDIKMKSGGNMWSESAYGEHLMRKNTFVGS